MASTTKLSPQEKYEVVGTERGARCLKARRDLDTNETILIEVPRYFVARLQDGNVHKEYHADPHTLAVLAYLHSLRQESVKEALEMYADTLGKGDFDKQTCLRALKSIKGYELMPQDKDMDWSQMEHYFRVMCTNNFVLHNIDQEAVGCGFFSMLSFVNHRCLDFNAVMLPIKRVIDTETNTDVTETSTSKYAFELRARRPIKAGEEITITYTSFTPQFGVLQRAKILLETYGFYCTCLTCVEEKKRKPVFAAAKMAVTSRSNYSGPRCQNCGVISVPLMRCSRCKKVLYCSTECQRADWKDSLVNVDHRLVCRPPT
jgi:hypothetical protein